MKDHRVKASKRARSRSVSYAFLAWIFLEAPDCDFISRLLADDHNNWTGLISDSTDNKSIISGLEMMHCSLRGNQPVAIEEICSYLAVEHTRLLRGVSREYGPPPPYESLYRSSEISSETSILVQIAEYYRQAQVKLPECGSDRIDYLGLELDFMRLLCEEESRCWEQGDRNAAEGFFQLSQRFLKEHLLAWVPIYCSSIIKHQEPGFYQGVARLLRGFLELEISTAGDYYSHPEQLVAVDLIR
jgi:TorA maturation chaperone TorD